MIAEDAPDGSSETPSRRAVNATDSMTALSRGTSRAGVGSGLELGDRCDSASVRDQLDQFAVDDIESLAKVLRSGTGSGMGSE
jgi:hypothetical protein